MKKLFAILMALLMAMSLMNISALAEGNVAAETPVTVSTTGSLEKDPCVCVSVSWTEFQTPEYHYGMQYWNPTTLQYYEKEDDKSGWINPLITTLTIRNDSNVPIDISLKGQWSSEIEYAKARDIMYKIGSGEASYAPGFSRNETRLGYAWSGVQNNVRVIPIRIAGAPTLQSSEPVKLGTLSVTITPILSDINPGY